MNRYECDECGFRFEEPDIVIETHGVTDGSHEAHGTCPRCHGYYEELFQCKICGKYFTDDDLTGKVCNVCIDESEDLDRCFKYGSECEESIAVNGFIASLLDVDTIESILWEKIKEASKVIPINCSEFINSDRFWYAEQLIKEKEKNNELW